jgi:hypothetical protein
MEAIQAFTRPQSWITKWQLTKEKGRVSDRFLVCLHRGHNPWFGHPSFWTNLLFKECFALQAKKQRILFWEVSNPSKPMPPSIVHLPLFGRDPKLQSFDLGRTKEKLWSSSTFPSPITSYGYIAKRSPSKTWEALAARLAVHHRSSIHAGVYTPWACHVHVLVT